MYPGEHAVTRPNHPAVVMAETGETITYGELDQQSNQLAQAWCKAGLRSGDGVALLASNEPWFFVVMWAAMRSGFYVTPVSRHLSAPEIAYIVSDCEARCLIVDGGLDGAAAAVAELLDVELLVAVGTSVRGCQDYSDFIAGAAETPLAEQPRGSMMLYSSGTTGRPKGIKRALAGKSISDPDGAAFMFQGLYGMDSDTVYLCPAPLYHAAPLAYAFAVQALGATVVLMRRFEPVAALSAIEEHSVTHAQFVPTMFIRMLKLDVAERSGFDLSSLQVAIHAAAPCPVAVKHEMIDWWGPVLYEYYAGSEGIGLTFLNSEQWLAHPGSVGPAILGVLHICDDAGDEVPIGETGTVYFENEAGGFTYHRDKDKTRDAEHRSHTSWRTLGDVGRVDEDGFLYLSDRKAFMIISGGVNIYPQEVEDCLIGHAAVDDVAVFGLPDPEMGEFVQAVIQPAAGFEPCDELEQELRRFVREHIAHYKVPRHFAFRSTFPRAETGKLYKRQLRDEMAAATQPEETPAP
jgi:long-chain acyl-CoA synthetase